ATPEAMNITLEDKDGAGNLAVVAVLVAVGRSPNGRKAGIPEMGVVLVERGIELTDTQGSTNDPNIFAIGDVT
ncbi:FAD-dependent oxidoreductase, partial [Marinomonas arenicola]